MSTCSLEKATGTSDIGTPPRCPEFDLDRIGEVLGAGKALIAGEDGADLEADADLEDILSEQLYNSMLYTFLAYALNMFRKFPEHILKNFLKSLKF
jgi:hypothetical protein